MMRVHVCVVWLNPRRDGRRQRHHVVCDMLATCTLREHRAREGTIHLFGMRAGLSFAELAGPSFRVKGLRTCGPAYYFFSIPSQQSPIVGIPSSDTSLKMSKYTGYARHCRTGTSSLVRVVLASDQRHNATLIRESEEVID
jgi:hypothetical protein